MDIILYTALCMSLIAFASARSKGSMDQHALRLNGEAEQEMDALVEKTRQLNEEIEDSGSMFKAGSDAISDSSSTGILPDDLFASGDAALGANAGGPASMFKAGSDAISDSSSTGILPDDLFASGDAALGANAGGPASMFKAGSDAISDSSSTGILTDGLFASGAAALGANAGDSESKFNGLKRSKTVNRLKDIHVSKQSKGGCATITCRPPDFKCQKDEEKCLHAKMQFAFCQEEKRKCAAKKISKKISNIKKNIKNFFMGGQQRQASDEVGRKIEDSLVAF